MKTMLIAGSIVLPLIMFYYQKFCPRLKLVYNLVTIIAALVFGLQWKSTALALTQLGFL